MITHISAWAAQNSQTGRGQYVYCRRQNTRGFSNSSSPNAEPEPGWSMSMGTRPQRLFLNTRTRDFTGNRRRCRRNQRKRRGRTSVQDGRQSSQVLTRRRLSQNTHLGRRTGVDFILRWQQSTEYHATRLSVLCGSRRDEKSAAKLQNDFCGKKNGHEQLPQNCHQKFCGGWKKLNRIT